MGKVEILGTGVSGLVGSRIVELLDNYYQFENLSLDTGVDITNKKQVWEEIKNSDARIILHLAAKADVDGCEKDKKLGVDGDAWKINVVGTENVVDACRESNKKIIYISTDFVFDGHLKGVGYTEEDSPHPLNWYGQTKYEGEKIITNSGLPYLIVRIAYPYRSRFEKKFDFVRSIIAKLKRGKKIDAVVDHIMTPTFIDDIASALKRLIEVKAIGIYHLVGSQHLTPYETALLIAEVFRFDSSLISKTTRNNYFREGAPRPFNLAIKNDKIQKLGVKMRSFEEGLKEIKKQLLITNY